MSFLNAIMQGLIQGLTEFLPVSSSGHLSVYQYFTGVSSEESSLFAVLLHLGTLLAVAAAFWPTVWSLIREFVFTLRDLFTGRFTLQTRQPRRRMLYMLVLSLLPLFLVLPFHHSIMRIMEDNDIVAEGIAFLITSAVLFWASSRRSGRRNAATMTPSNALTIGVAQCIATVPGISRSGSTIAAGLLCGLERSYAVAYSFILGIPAVLGAAILELKDLKGSALALNPGPAVAGMIVAAVSGFCAIKLVQYLVVKDKLKIFAVYTLVVGLIVLILGIEEHVTGGALRTAISAAL